MCTATLLKLTAVCLVSSACAAATGSTNAVNLFPRASDSCAIPNHLPCTLPGLPSTFCCPSGSVCLPFNNAASVLCCPSGRNCKTIEPILCDITQQNATLFPSNPLHSTDLKGTLQACGSGCCPKGFTCQNGQCSTKENAILPVTTQASTPKPSSSTTLPMTSTLYPSTSASSTPTSTAVTQSSIPTAIALCEYERFPAIAIVAGFLPGLFVGIVLATLVVICRRHRRRGIAASQKGSEFGSHSAATVSEPMSHPGNNAFRTDFLRRQSKAKQRASRVKSIFSKYSSTRSSTLRAPDGIGRSLQGSVHTPKNLRREPSLESIKIYSPPSAAFARPPTTFADMMANAGFKPGEPYVDPPPRARLG